MIHLPTSEYMELRHDGPSPSGKTERYSVVSRHKFTLGQIRWYARWRCYTFLPVEGALFNYGCLSDLAVWCDVLTRRHRERAAP